MESFFLLRRSEPAPARHHQIRRAPDRFVAIENHGRVFIVALHVGKKIGETHRLRFRRWRGFAANWQWRSRRLLHGSDRRRDWRNFGIRLGCGGWRGVRPRLGSGGRVRWIGGPGGLPAIFRVRPSTDVGFGVGLVVAGAVAGGLVGCGAPVALTGTAAGSGVAIGPAGAGFSPGRSASLQFHRARHRNMCDAFRFVDPAVAVAVLSHSSCAVFNFSARAWPRSAS